MLRTVLLMDGSEAMNSSSDYLPSYLLAMRPPLLRLVEKYLDSTPLASLGLVVMRDGVSHRLLPCTTNRNEIVDVLERDIFLHGGSGTMSLENGLRMAMSELVDMRKVAAMAAKSGKNGATAAAAAATNTRAAWKGSATQLNVILVSASVTLIDPTDVFKVVNTMTALSIRIHVVSLVGAVHVFDVCAVETGGALHCPLNFDHLLEIVDALATAHRARAATAAAARQQQRSRRRVKRQRATSGDAINGGENTEDAEEDVDAPSLIPIGCPVYVEAPPPSATQPESGGATMPSESASDAPSYFLACPQCHLIQLSVPTTCPMCRLLLCSAPMLYSTYVSHNTLVPPATRLRVVQRVQDGGAPVRQDSAVSDASSSAAATAQAVVSTAEKPVHCDLCMTRIPADAVAATDGTAAAAAAPSRVSEAAWVWRCSACGSFRCDGCNDFVVNTVGLCPHCVALR